MDFLKGTALEEKLRGRTALSGSIKLLAETSKGRLVEEDFVIFGVVNTGGSCICYKADRLRENGMTQMGTLKEFYPIDSDNGSRGSGKYSYHLKRYDVDEGEFANQLYSDESTRSNFEDAKKEFCQAHYKVQSLIEKNVGSDSYFQTASIYRGISKHADDNYTVYVWVPGDSQLESFEDHLQEMQRRVEKEIASPRGNLNLFLANELHFILQSIKALAKGIQVIHQQSLLHLDIKPSNFGVRDLGEKNGDNISVSMFDVNSFYFRDGNCKIKTQGTKYFSAPELSGDRAAYTGNITVGCLSDIFSLGATLYNSIIVNKGGRGFYEVEKFGAIASHLRHSLLFEYSEYTSGVDIIDGLTFVLKRSLARCSEDFADGVTNFECVSEFIDAIDKVDEKVKNVIALGIEEGTDKKATLKIEDREEYYGRVIEGSGGAASSMQCLLYDYPLYNYVKNGTLNVLVLGAGVFGQKFLDIALELSQISGCYLNVVVASKDKKNDQRRYLESRPEFRNYFRVNGNKPLYAEKYASYGNSVYCDYGSVRFVEIKSELTMNSEENIAALTKTLGSGEKFGYVFISLADESLNKRIASDLSKTHSLLSEKSIINFVTYEKFPTENGKYRLSVKRKKGVCIPADADLSIAEINPVFITESLIAHHQDCNFLHTIGFNCHILWESNLSLDMAKAYETFMSPYYYSASMSIAVSIKYKLHSIGLSLENVRAAKTVEARRIKMLELTKAYREKIGLGEAVSTEAQKKCLNELTKYEHARWLTNMICSSHTLLPESEFKFLKSGNKDRAQRKHSCILPSGSEWTLGGEEWTESLDRWDNPGLTQSNMFKKLDPLDQMSVQLHRHYMNIAKEFSKDKFEAEVEIARRYLTGNYELTVAFNAYITAMYGIMLRKKRQSTAMKNLDHCESVFSEKLEKINPSNKDEISKKLKEIKSLFAPIKEAYSFIDYKELDHRILVGLPFVLNYSIQQRLCIPLITEKTDNKWFESVASCMVINPSTVTYMLHVDKPSKIASNEILSALSNITKIMDGHNLQTDINLIFYVETGEKPLSESAVAEAKAELKRVSDRIDSVDFVELNYYHELNLKIKNTFETIQKSPLRFSAVEINSADISGALSGMLYEMSVPSHRFNSVTMRFGTLDGSDYCWFNDIPFETHLHIEDAFMAHGRLGVYYEPELHMDYDEIWRNCSNNFYQMESWKALCKALKDKVTADNRILNLLINDKPDENKTKVETAHYLPMFCRAAIEKILTFLADKRVGLVESWDTREHNSTMFCVKFKSEKAVQKAFASLLSKNIYAFADEANIRTVIVKKFASVFLDSLIVENFDFEKALSGMPGPNGNSNYTNARKIFRYLIEKGYIVDLSEKGFVEFGDEEPLTEKSFKFCFASPQIKNLLTSEGQLAELYTYYKAVESGFYDEIRTSLEVQRKKDDDVDEFISTQEFDIVAVKGFSTQFVEVKCCNKLESVFYSKLRSNGENFGINKKLVLVSLSADRFHLSNNEEVIKHGETENGVKTIVGKGNRICDDLIKMMKDTDEN